MQEIDQKLKKILESKILLGVLYGIGGVVVALLIFIAGINVGFDKASFGHAWGDNYEKNFGMVNRGIARGMPGNFPNAHGAVGKIIQIQLPTIIVADKDDTEKVVLITDDTRIVNATSEINSSDLKIDDSVVVIGSPNSSGQIEAKFIRIIPSPNSLINNPTNTNVTQ